MRTRGCLVLEMQRGRTLLTVDLVYKIQNCAEEIAEEGVETANTACRPARHGLFNALVLFLPKALIGSVAFLVPAAVPFNSAFTLQAANYLV